MKFLPSELRPEVDRKTFWDLKLQMLSLCGITVADCSAVIIFNFLSSLNQFCGNLGFDKPIPFGYITGPVYSAKKAGLGRGSARPFCHCKRTKRPNARPKTAAAETISRGSLGRGSARPFLTVNASRPKCGTKCDPRIRKYVWSSWHHRIWRHYPAFFFDRCSYFVFFFLLWRLPNLSV